MLYGKTKFKRDFRRVRSDTKSGGGAILNIKRRPTLDLICSSQWSRQPIVVERYNSNGTISVLLFGFRSVSYKRPHPGAFKRIDCSSTWRRCQIGVTMHSWYGIGRGGEEEVAGWSPQCKSGGDQGREGIISACSAACRRNVRNSVSHIRGSTVNGEWTREGSTRSRSGGCKGAP